jgi:glycosyltransferase involved in cell wall biosynthesis
MKQNNVPLISVVMSVYNEKIEWLHESIDSILYQTFSDFEFIIVNDNPNRTENSNILKEYQKKDNRIVVITNEQNIGLTKSLNKGIKIAKGKYIARMDADDISLPMRFEKQVEIMENNPDIIVCGSKIKVFGEKKTLFISPEKSDEIKNLLLKRSSVCHPTAFIRRKILIENDILYDEHYGYTQDYKLWIDLCDFGKFCNIQKVLLRYRTSKSQISQAAKDMQHNLSILCRREYIRKTLMKHGCSGIIDWDNITVSALKHIKQYDIPNIIIEVFYLSLKNHKIKEWIYFSLSFDFLRFSVRNNMSIIRRFFQKRDKLL